MSISFAKVLILSFLATSILPVAMIGIPLTSKIIQDTERESKEKLKLKTSMIERDLKETLIQTDIAFTTLTEARDLQLVMSSSLYGGSAREFMANFIKSNEIYRAIFVLDKNNFQVEVYPDEFMAEDHDTVWKSIQLHTRSLTKDTRYHIFKAPSTVKELLPSSQNINSDYLLTLSKTIFDNRGNSIGHVVGILTFDDIGKRLTGVVDSTDYLRVTQHPNMTIFEKNIPITDHITMSSDSYTVENLKEPFKQFLKTLKIGLSTNRNAVFADVESTRWQLLGISVVVIVLSLGTGLLLSQKLASPIAVMTKTIDQLSRKDYQLKIAKSPFKEFDTLAKTLKTMAESIHTNQNNLEHLVDVRTEELAIKNSEFNSIFHNVTIGIIAIGKHLEIFSEYSRETENIFETETIAGQSLETLLLRKMYMDIDNVNLIKDMIQVSIGEDRFTFDINKQHFPQEIRAHIGDGVKYLAFQWDAIESINGTIEKILLTIKDITKQREAEQKSNNQEFEINLLLEMLKHFTPDTRQMIEAQFTLWYETENLINASAKPNPLILRKLHTLKGNLLTVGLVRFSKAVHHLELAFRRDKLNRSDAFTEVKNLASRYKRIYQEKIIININVFEKHVSDIYERLSMINAMSDQSQKSHQIKQLVREHDYLLLKDALKPILDSLDMKANQLSKKIPNIVMRPDNGLVYKKISPTIYSIMNHLINNTLAHGCPDAKSFDTCTVSIDLEPSQTGISIRYTDDGKGIDIQKLRQKLDPRQELSVNELFRKAMHHQLSNTKTITQISGFGIGLSAVEELVTKIGGTFDVTLADATIQGRIPFSCVITINKDYIFIKDSVIPAA